MLRMPLDPLRCWLASALPAMPRLPRVWRRYSPDCYLEFPRGGSQAMVDALVRGLEKHGGRLQLRSHVQQILVENGRAAGEAWAPRADGEEGRGQRGGPPGSPSRCPGAGASRFPLHGQGQS